MIIARPGVREIVSDRFAAVASNKACEAEPNEVIVPGQCDAFQQEIARTYDFSPARMNHSQVEAQSQRLDAFWGKVRQSRGRFSLVFAKRSTKRRSDSFFNIDGSMLLVDIDPSRASQRPCRCASSSTLTWMEQTSNTG